MHTTASDLTTSAFISNNTVSAPIEKIKFVEETENWSSTFSTSIIATRLDSSNVEATLESLLASPEYGVILSAAQNLSQKLNIGSEEATERLILKFREIDACWEKLLLKKGAQSLLGIK